MKPFNPEATRAMQLMFDLHFQGRFVETVPEELEGELEERVRNIFSLLISPHHGIFKAELDGRTVYVLGACRETERGLVICGHSIIMDPDLQHALLPATLVPGTEETITGNGIDYPAPSNDSLSN